MEVLNQSVSRKSDISESLIEAHVLDVLAALENNEILFATSLVRSIESFGGSSSFTSVPSSSSVSTSLTITRIYRRRLLELLLSLSFSKKLDQVHSLSCLVTGMSADIADFVDVAGSFMNAGESWFSIVFVQNAQNLNPPSLRSHPHFRPFSWQPCIIRWESSPFWLISTFSDPCLHS